MISVKLATFLIVDELVIRLKSIALVGGAVVNKDPVGYTFIKEWIFIGCNMRFACKILPSVSVLLASELKA